MEVKAYGIQTNVSYHLHVDNLSEEEAKDLAHFFGCRGEPLKTCNRSEGALRIAGEISEKLIKFPA